MLKIEVHKIRYWDSIDPKTNKYRIDGISTKSKGGTRYFNKENIKKLEKLKSILYEGKNQNYSIKLADQIHSLNNRIYNKKDNSSSNSKNADNNKKIEQILNKMRILLKTNNYK